MRKLLLFISALIASVTMLLSESLTPVYDIGGVVRESKSMLSVGETTRPAMAMDFGAAVEATALTVAKPMLATAGATVHKITVIQPENGVITIYGADRKTLLQPDAGGVYSIEDDADFYVKVVPNAGCRIESVKVGDDTYSRANGNLEPREDGSYWGYNYAQKDITISAVIIEFLESAVTFESSYEEGKVLFAVAVWNEAYSDYAGIYSGDKVQKGTKLKLAAYSSDKATYQIKAIVVTPEGEEPIRLAVTDADLDQDGNYVKYYTMPGKAITVSPEYTGGTVVVNPKLTFQESYEGGKILVLAEYTSKSGNTIDIHSGEEVPAGTLVTMTVRVTQPRVYKPKSITFEVEGKDPKTRRLSDDGDGDYSCMYTVNEDTKATLNYVVNAPQKVTITLTAPAPAEGTLAVSVGGTDIAPVNGVVSVEKGKTVRITATPTAQYQVEAITIDGVAYSIANGKAVADADAIYAEVVASANIASCTATFKSKKTMRHLTVIQPENGVITIYGEDKKTALQPDGSGVYSVEDNGDFYVKIVPNTGCQIESVTIGGNTYSKANGQLYLMSDGSYWGYNYAQSDITISAVIVESLESPVTFESSYEDGKVSLAVAAWNDTYSDYVNIYSGYNVQKGRKLKLGAYSSDKATYQIKAIVVTPEGEEPIRLEVADADLAQDGSYVKYYTMPGKAITVSLEYTGATVVVNPKLTFQESYEGGKILVTAEYDDKDNNPVAIHSGDEIPVGAMVTMMAKATEQGVYKLKSFTFEVEGKDPYTKKLSNDGDDIYYCYYFINEDAKATLNYENAPEKVKITLTAPAAEEGTLTVSVGSKKLTPVDGVVSVEKGKTVRITATPTAKYEAESITIDGVAYTVANGKAVADAATGAIYAEVVANADIASCTATFKLKKVIVHITVTQPENGTITLLGADKTTVLQPAANGTYDLDENAAYYVKVEPKAEYLIKSITVGDEVFSKDKGNLTLNEDGSYLGNFTATKDISISALMEKVPVVEKHAVNYSPTQANGDIFLVVRMKGDDGNYKYLRSGAEVPVGTNLLLVAAPMKGKSIVKAFVVTPEGEDPIKLPVTDADKDNLGAYTKEYVMPAKAITVTLDIEQPAPDPVVKFKESYENGDIMMSASYVNKNNKTVKVYNGDAVPMNSKLKIGAMFSETAKKKYQLFSITLNTKGGSITLPLKSDGKGYYYCEYVVKSDVEAELDYKEAVAYYKVMIIQPTEGTISAKVGNETYSSNTPVKEGSVIDFTFTPSNEKYNVKSWLLDGNAVENTKDKNTYRLTVTKDASVGVAVYSPIENVAAQKLAVRLAGNELLVSGCADNAVVRVYDITGRNLIETIEKRIDMSGYAAGIYFVKVDGAVVKIVR